MKQVVDETVDILSASGTDVLPVCADSPDELETGKGLAELFGSLYFVDLSVSHIGPVAHADVRAAEPVPMGVAVVDLSTSEVKLDSEEDPPLSAIIGTFISEDRVIEKIVCHLKSTKLCFLLRPASSCIAGKVKQKYCEKVILECGSHENAIDMKTVFEEWQVTNDPVRRILADTAH